jgi:phosphonopyruvate decarboxylase
MMRRDECFDRLAALRGDAIVVATYSSAFEWRRASPSPLNYYSVGAMGQASSHALGLALGLPDHKIIVLDGDGSLLMNLGTLVTIANVRPTNLVHFVSDNGCYEANGSHPTPGQGRVSFAGFARDAGYPHVFEFDDLATWEAELPRVLSLPGPVFGALKVVPGAPLDLDYDFIHGPEVRRQFKEAIRPLRARQAVPKREPVAT